MKTSATLGSRKNNPENYFRNLPTSSSEKLPLINLFVAYFKRRESYSLIWTISFTSEWSPSTCCDRASIYFIFLVNASSSIIFDSSRIFLASYMLTNLQISLRKTSFFSASRYWWLILVSSLRRLSSFSALSSIRMSRELESEIEWASFSSIFLLQEYRFLSFLRNLRHSS